MRLAVLSVLPFAAPCLQRGALPQPLEMVLT
jgi:hypothetical protein